MDAGEAYLYLLRCADGSLYCGWSVDLDRRLAAHAAGRASRYTASRRPVELAAAWRTRSRTDARRLEVAVKRLPRPAKLALLAGAALPGVAASPPEPVRCGSECAASPSSSPP